MANQKHLCARETLLFIRLVRWGLQSLDIYTLTSARGPLSVPSQPPAPQVRSKEEREVLEHFSGVVSFLFCLYAVTLPFY